MRALVLVASTARVGCGKRGMHPSSRFALVFTFCFFYLPFFANTLGAEVLIWAGLVRIAAGPHWPKRFTRIVLALSLLLAPSPVVVSLMDGQGPPRLVPVVGMHFRHREAVRRGDAVYGGEGCTTVYIFHPRWALVW